MGADEVPILQGDSQLSQRPTVLDGEIRGIYEALLKGMRTEPKVLVLTTDSRAGEYVIFRCQMWAELRRSGLEGLAGHRQALEEMVGAAFG